MSARIEAAAAQLRAATDALMLAAHDEARRALPPMPAGVEGLLRELAEAHADKAAHPQRFAREMDVMYERQSEECRRDWSRVLSRLDSAVRELLLVGQRIAAQPAQESEAAE